MLPFDLTWDDVDPRRHPFDAGSVPAIVSALDPAAHVPAPPPGDRVKLAMAGDLSIVMWARDKGDEWTGRMTEALVDRFGPWASGWRWARDEGDIGGGPVGSWCCAADSITTPTETLARVGNALCEWRAWLEELAEHFDRYPPDDEWAAEPVRHWKRATTHLVTVVIERTNAGDAWYAHCKLVLTWFLTRWGVAQDTARERVEQAIGGSFGSWVAPDRKHLASVTKRLAESLRDDA